MKLGDLVEEMQHREASNAAITGNVTYASQNVKGKLKLFHFKFIYDFKFDTCRRTSKKCDKLKCIDKIEINITLF